MSDTQTQSIPRDQFLTMAANLLYRALLEPSRTEAKKLFRELEQGRDLHLTDVRMEDQSTVRFMLGLDATELGGKLNYGAFRASVATLVHNIGEQLKTEDAQIQVFTQENNPAMTVFGISGVTYEGTDPRVMVLGAESLQGQPAVMLRLMYLDPGQFDAEPAQPA